VGEIEVVSIGLPIVQRRRFGVDRVLLLTDIGVAHIFSKSGHDTVLDSVVDHLDEVTGGIRAAVQATDLQHHIGTHSSQSDHRGTTSRIAARSRSMAAMTLSLSLKIADPATSTSAPAATASGAVATSIPPSTSRLHLGLIRSIIWPTPDLRERRVKEVLMSESGFTVMTSTLVEVLHDLLQNGRGSRRVNGDTDPFPQRVDALHGAREIVVALPVDQK